MHGHERAITYLKYSPDGDVFFSAAKDSTPTMWRASTGERIGVFHGHDGAVFQLDTTSDTKYLISASMESKSIIWEVNTGKVIKTISLDSPIRTVAVSEGDKFLCLGTMSFARNGSCLFIYDLSVGMENLKDPLIVIKDVCPLSVNIVSVIWSPLNKSLILGCTDGHIRIVDAESGKLNKTIEAHEGDITSLIASYDRTMFATSSKDASAKIYDMLTYEELACYKTDRPLNGVALSPIFDHMVVVGGVEARDVTTTRTQKMESLFFNYAVKEEIGRVKGSFGTMNSVQFSPDGKSFITGGEDGYVRLCFFDDEYFKKDANEEKRLRELEAMATKQ
ncbi:eukaryotic translation initiation factor 3 subunit I-like protein [Blastocystis sp. subtype 4]|uniref:eukaryotic translation initiation factor 3 subunit I-like protein n=1 Tax=Blastocystis sp. subtype 4 TaxID=944170 RepID=UPI0007120435|nr:eukaryotic translation initiation factor 3 subunit I-like protein [Blastocystis sp. subtype 4]KNB44316.1 eukaryotic translation initiation factor 3 subunit I-like protein [Blastocystis sp. subtype 4]|eukprot:XP_014527759.1 eukaryotic translation initiation factor 3 subunit I-like protein [Blastocystis sp. subtype 4]